MNNETDLQYHINDDLRGLGVMHFHRKNSRGGKYVTANVFKFGGKNLAWPDLIIYPDKGDAFFVELKWGSGKLDPDQLNFQEWALNNGYRFYVVYSVVGWENVKTIEFKYMRGNNDILSTRE